MAIRVRSDGTMWCAESGPYVGKDAAVSAIEIAARQWLSGGDK